VSRTAHPRPLAPPSGKPSAFPVRSRVSCPRVCLSL
jgi:hypothetical protein